MYTGRIFNSNINWILLRVRSFRHGFVFEKSTILFRSITSWPLEVNTISAKSSLTRICDKEHEQIATVTTITDVDIEEIIKRSDKLFHNDQFKDAYNCLLQYPNQSLPELKWRLARILYSLSRLQKSKSARCKMIDDALKLIKSALENSTANFFIHKWMSIILDAKVEYNTNTIKLRIEQITQVHEHIEKAVELNPNDPKSWHFLGAIEYGLAELPWMQKKFVEKISQTLLKKGSYERAFKYFQNAESIRPGFYLKNLLMLGKCAFALKKIPDAKRFLRTVLQFCVVSKEDNFCHVEAVQLLKKIRSVSS